MVLANLLLDTTGKPADSYVNFDVMRLPLGILTGVGFIGAGAILHKGNLVLGVTTAATLWFATVMGFFFGGGEYTVGLLLLAMGAAILWLMDWVEGRMPSRHDATLVVRLSAGAPHVCDFEKELGDEGFRAMLVGKKISARGEERRYAVSWHATARETKVPRIVSEISRRPEIDSLKWDALGRE
jgi:putative Mg2+ transporter-C (MgtC) family protein